MKKMKLIKSKKMLTVLLTATAAMAVTPMAGYAETVQTKQIVNQSSEATVEVLSGNCGPVDEEGNFTESTKWSLEKNSEAEEFYTLRISGNGRMADFTINNTEDNRPWKDYLDSIKKVEMESGITSIGSWAFSNMINLEEANIPLSVESLGDCIFRNDTALTTVTWPENFEAPELVDSDSNTNIYKGRYVPTSMFDGCTSLGEGIDLEKWLPSSFEGVGCAAFRKTMFSVNFDEWSNLKYIGAYGFAEIPNLDSVTIKDSWEFGMRGANSNAFNGSGLREVVVEDKRTEIPNAMFCRCNALESITLGKSIEKIGTNAFSGTSSLKNIDLKNVTQISGYAFYDSGLRELILPKKVRLVDGRAFGRCAELEKIYIDSDNVALNGNSFTGCSSLSYIETAENTSVAMNNSFKETGQPGETAAVNLEEINAKGTISGRINELTGLKKLSMDGDSEIAKNINRIATNSLQTLTISGNSYEFDGYCFAKNNVPENLIVTAKNTKASDKKEAAFRSNHGIKNAKFTGKNVELQSKMFAGCANLDRLDLSKAENVTFGSQCFGDDTNTGYTGGSVNKFNKNCVIYVANNRDAQKARSDSGISNDAGIILVANGGIVLDQANGIDAVVKDGYCAEWYNNAEFNGDAVTTTESGHTYYAKWIKSSYKVTPGSVAFGSVEYKEDAEPKTVIATSSNAEEFSIKAFCSDDTIFDIGVTGREVTITPKTDNAVGEYREEVYITLNNGTAFIVPVTMRIEQEEPAYEEMLPTGLIADQWQKLSEVKGLPKEFKWKNPKTILKEYGLQKFEAVYTPDDKNYHSVDCMVEVDVMPEALVMNSVPVITAEDITLTVEDKFDPKDGVTAWDEEDEDLTDKIEITYNDVDTKKAGLYKVIYKVTDSDGATVTKNITVTVNPKMETLNAIPTISAKDVTLTAGDSFDAKKNVAAADAEDGDLTAKIEVIANDVDTTKAGTYHVMYKITDSQGASVTKTITVTVKEKAQDAKPSNNYSSSSDSDDGGEPASSTTRKTSLASASTLEGFWKRNEKGWWFEAKDGSYPKSSWKLIGWNGKQQWYHFDENGYMQTGWIKDNGIWYYLHNQADGSQGHMYTGWHLIDGKWYYFSEGMKQPQGAMLANTTTPDGYEVGPDGAWTGK